MSYIRWYDKDPDLSHLMHFIEGLNDEVRNEIAQDLIQIMPTVKFLIFLRAGLLNTSAGTTETLLCIPRLK